ncbi:MAG: serine/threonine-protein kinase, partial [Gemmataceae bacterium]
MSDLSSYFVRWDQAFEEGRDLSPEELCPDQPELHDALRQVIAIMRLLRKNPSLGPRPAADDRSPDPAKQANKPVPPPRSGDAGKAGQPQSPPASSTWTDGRETSSSSDLALPTSNPPGYEILETLGKGGMGIVYLARQVKLNRIVALKMILTGFHQFRELRERFLIEAESIARINHPGIVQVYEFGMVGEVPFFSLEFCPGGNLAKRLTGTPLPAREVAQMVEKMADAVEAAHRAGIVHRDLKPANVLIDATGNPRISDFGLAKKIDEQGLTRPGVPLGTPCYMSPEQAQGVEGGKLTDVYALGGILYECLTGRPPFKGVSTHETLQQVLYQEPVPVRMLQPRAPVDLETISLKCLQKNPARRYASAGELGEDLRRWLRGEPIHARPVGRLEKLWLWARRKPERAIACGLFLVFLAGSLIFASILSRQRQDRRESEARRNTKVESLLGEAHDNLEQPPPAKDFLAAWKAAVESASSALQRARDLEANEKVPLDPPVREQMRDLEHDLATMKSHIGLADQFERLQINRVFGRSLDHRMFPADVAQQYEKVFATIGIHVGGDIPA